MTLKCKMMDVFILSVVLLSYGTQVSALLKLSPLNLTVLRGDEVRFSCSSDNAKWDVMLWELNSTVVVTISRIHGVLSSSLPNVTAEKSRTVNGWDLVLKSVERLHQGRVSCNIQGEGRETAWLFVQEKGTVNIFGGSTIALKGDLVRFECSAEGWYPEPSLQWEVHGKKLSQAAYDLSREVTGKGLFTVNSNLSVTATRSSRVDCLASVFALATPLKSSVRLTVVAEVAGGKDDCTVPLAVTSSLTALLLLLLLCVCAVLWYRERSRAKTSTQDAKRYEKSNDGPTLPAEPRGGRVNFGYMSEGTPDAVYNEIIEEIRSKMDFVGIEKGPDVVTSSNISLHGDPRTHVNLSEEDSKNIRRVTTV
ncbi:SH3 domain-binding glutamic acid-rich protein isoform X2 [Syngnathoides biaculeatus]|uniref:SH3 domain-binding glutamic acid-rich protein isoform X2 n=1 Tax=Syngnathoides biaculeatus TaxID=300417 RepID=UPI002ADE8934|nr:SH3 domain-binding glutamic acid-rich protein isoform X2 [Syngnathoides biaculeatus]